MFLSKVCFFIETNLCELVFTSRLFRVVSLSRSYVTVSSLLET